MKKIFLLSVSIASALLTHAQNVPSGGGPLTPTVPLITLPTDFSTSDGFNFTRSFLPHIQTNDPGNVLFDITATDYRVTTNTVYTDGWGNPIQSILKGFAGKPNLVQPYDNRGSLTTVSFLPYCTASGSYFQASPFSAQQSYYLGLYPSEPNRTYSKSATTYVGGVPNFTVYSQGSSFEGSGNGTTVATTVSTAADAVRKYNSSGSSYTLSGVYDPGQLLVKTTYGPHAARTVEYFDKDNREVCKRNYETVAGVPQTVSTYYVYNDLGLLSNIITPEATYLTDIGIGAIGNLVYSNQYNEYGSVVTKQTPGKAASECFVYDSRNRLVLYQSPLLRAAGKYKFNLYDKKGRVVISGLFNSTLDYATWQGAITGTPGSSGSLLYYLQNGVIGAYPTSISDCEIETVNFYDHYEIPRSFSNAMISYFLGQDIYVDAVTPYMVTNGLQTASLSRVRDGGMGTSSDKWTCSVYFYDFKGRILQVQSLNATNAQSYATCLSGAPTASWDEITTQYCFDGVKRQEMVVLNDNSLSTNKTMTKYLKYYIRDYVKQGKLSEIGLKIDDGIEQNVAKYTYDDLGRVSKKTMSTVEEQNYEYNIQGKLTAINRGYVNDPCSAAGATSSFGCTLSYDFGFSKPRFDGNISGFTWRGASHTVPMRAYGYDYDPASRITSADFRQWSDGSNTAGCGALSYMTSWNNIASDFTVSDIQYDYNGNMLQMVQQGTTATGPVTMDVMTYKYNSYSDKLASVTDAITTNFGIGDFTDVYSSCGGSPCPDYTYDADGNMASDVNKGITNITYNELDEPLTVTYGTGATISNVYTADGTLTTKIAEYPVGSSWMHKEYRYIGGLVYENDKLQYLLHDEGRARFNESSGYFTFDYFVKDHLGNVRNVVTGNRGNDPAASSTTTGSSTTSYLATHEVAASGTENLFFTHLDEVRDDKPDPLPGDVKAARLNAAEPDRRIGTTLVLKVMAGDKFDINAQSYWEDDGSQPDAVPNEIMFNTLLQTLTDAAAQAPNGDQGATQIVNSLLSGPTFDVYQSIQDGVTHQSKPLAFVNYMVFDENMNLVRENSGAFQVQDAGLWNFVGSTSPIEITRNGYVVIYIGNSHTRNVYFDGLHVNLYQGTLIQEQHYYPHGLAINVGESPTLTKNRYKYQGKELIDDAGLNLYDFTARQYDPQIGRFWGVDPASQFPSGYIGMGNDPANMIDPTGMWSNSPTGNFDPARAQPLRMNTEMHIQGDPWEAEIQLMKAFATNQEKLDMLEKLQKDLGTGGNGGLVWETNKFGKQGIWIRTFSWPGQMEQTASGNGFMVGNVSATISWKFLNAGLTGSEGMGEGWLSKASDINTKAAMVAGLTEVAGAGRTVSMGVKLMGKQYSRTLGVSKVAHGAGIGMFAAGFLLDGYGSYRYMKYGANDPDAVHPAKWGVNTGVGLSGFFGPAGFIGSSVYFGLELWYPGGAAGAAQDNASYTEQNRAILGQSFDLYPKEY